MPHYKVDSAQTKMFVQARSNIHDTTTTFPAISGNVEVDPADLAGAKASFTVSMKEFDAGDWLKNRKMKSELAPDKYPSASFELTGLRDINQSDDGAFAAIAQGVLRYRNKELQAEITGQGTIDGTTIAATGTFDIDLRDFAMKPPRILMFKMEPELSIEVTLRMRS